MKRRLFIVLMAIMAALCCAFGLTACGGDDSGNNNNVTHFHNYSDWKSDNYEHWRECLSNEGACDLKIIEKTLHFDTNNDGKCDICKYEVGGVVDEHKHTLTLVDGKDPTCMSSGNSSYYTCDDCKKWFWDSDAKSEIDNKSSVILLKTVHNLSFILPHEATCFVDGNIEYFICGYCKKWFLDVFGQQEITDKTSVIIPKAHKIMHVENKEATCTEDGNIEYYSCSRCDKWYEDEACKNEIIDKKNFILEKIGHSFKEKICTVCGALQPTEGLIYEKFGDEYSVCGIGTATDTDIVISSTYNGYPVTRISYSAFSGCSELTSITIPEGVTYIDWEAFRDCSKLVNISIPESINTLGRNIFYGCDNLQYYEYENALYLGNKNNPYVVLVKAKDIEIDSCTINEKAKAIYEYAFENCSILESIIIPDSVIFINDFVFKFCDSLVSLSVSEGNTKYFSQENCIIESLNGGKSIIAGCKNSIIPNDVFSIGVAFNGCSGLTSVTIPNSVKTIGQYAFGGCSDLATVTIEGEVEAIGDAAFKNCSSLTNITIPNSVTEIGQYAFSDCSGLISITLPDCLTFIGQGVFDNCSSLTSITIPKSVTSIGDNAFSGCSSLESIIIPDSVTQIGRSAFNFSGLSDIKISDSVTQIGERAFAYCNNLNSITIPKSVIIVGNYLFEGWSNLTAYCEAERKPDGWANEWHSNCDIVWNCKSNDIAEDRHIYFVVEGIRYSLYNGSVSVVEQQDNNTDVTIPATVTYKENTYKVTSVIADAFFGCHNLSSITISDGITSIGVRSFMYCVGLTSITIPDSVNDIGYDTFLGCNALTIYCEEASKPDWWSIIDYPIVWDCKNNDVADDGYIYTVVDGIRYALKDVEAMVVRQPTNANRELTVLQTVNYKDNTYNVTTIMDNAFESSSLTGITISEGVTSIGENAFATCKTLIKVSIPNSITSIKNTTFMYCHSLKSIIIPDGVTEICQYAFYECSSLKSITIPESVTSIGMGAFFKCGSLTSIIIPDSVSSIGGYVFAYNDSLTSVKIGNGITSISNNMFYDCGSLKNITIPNSITAIKQSAFYRCHSLTSIVIPDSVTSIAKEAFYDCERLISIIIPDSVTSIGESVFCGCSNLKSVKISNKVTSIEYGVFRECSNLKSVEIPDSVTSIGNNAFSYCTSLISITIPDSVISIGDYAFSYCSSLTSITIPKSITSISDYAFSGCSNLISITVADGNKKYHNDGNCLIETDSKRLIVGCENSIIPDDGSVTLIGASAFFGRSGLVSIEIPDGITSIGASAFYGCSSLISIIIPVSVTTIGNGAFFHCINLKDINYRGTKEQWKAIVNDNGWDYNTGEYTVHCTDGDISK